MFVNLKYNPKGKVWDYPGVEKTIDTIRKDSGDEVAEYYANLKWEDVLTKLSDGVYEYYDVNDPRFDNIKFNTHEYVTPEIANELNCEYVDFLEYKGKIFMSHPYGVCDNWEQIFEREPDIKYYKDSKEKFVIFLCKHTKSQQPQHGGWRWHKWGEYIGDQNPQCEYLKDEPEIEYIYTYHIARIIEK